jgi:hypothetical protein
MIERSVTLSHGEVFHDIEMDGMTRSIRIPANTIHQSIISTNDGVGEQSVSMPPRSDFSTTTIGSEA